MVTPRAFGILLGTGVELLCPLVVVGGVVAVLVLLLKRGMDAQRDEMAGQIGGGGARPGQTPAGPFQHRVVRDGFWLWHGSISPGSTIHYRYRTPGGIRTGRVLYHPGPDGHFIYTGETPADIHVIDVSAPMQTSGQDFDEPAPSSGRQPVSSMETSGGDFDAPGPSTSPEPASSMETSGQDFDQPPSASSGSFPSAY
jgi:hypothetical protein